MERSVVIIGGFGHVGLPLAIALANKGVDVCAFDIDAKTGALIDQGIMPFMEHGAAEALPAALRSGRLRTSLDPRCIAEADTVVIVIGTPVDAHLNPQFELMQDVLTSYLPYFKDGQLLVLRSTVYPGSTDRLTHWFAEHGKSVDLAFCPERIAEGYALQEIETLPQIVSSTSEEGVRRANELFSALTKDVVVLAPIEAELTKLFNNVWRYVKFATANQFFMIANDHGADFYRVLHGMTHKYPRARDFPGPGFAAGPCLFKDAMQLAAFNNNSFYLGHAAMLVNEGLANYVVNRLKMRHNLRTKCVGILGMAFKGNSDDPRESLSFKLRKILAFETSRVLCSDVYVEGDGFVSQDELVERSDIVIVATPHREYAAIEVPDGVEKEIVDIWNMYGRGCVI